MGTLQCFSTIFIKGNNFCDFLFDFFLEDEALSKRGLLLKKRIYSRTGLGKGFSRATPPVFSKKEKILKFYVYTSSQIFSSFGIQLVAK